MAGAPAGDRGTTPTGLEKSGANIATDTKTSTAPPPSVSRTSGVLSRLPNRPRPTPITTEHREHDGDDRPAGSLPGSEAETGPHRGHRWNRRRTPCGRDRRNEGDADPDDERGDHRARGDHDVERRQSEAHRIHQGTQPEGQQHAADEAEHRCNDADDQRFEHRTDPDLGAAGAERTDQRELFHPLTEQDVERVPDDERADEHRDERKPEQDVAEDVEHPAEVVLLLGDDDVAGDRSRPPPAVHRSDLLTSVSLSTPSPATSIQWI